MANANSVWIPQVWAAEALQVLKRNTVMAAEVNKDYSNEIANHGDTVNIQLPGSFVVNAKSAGSNVTIQDATSSQKQCVLQYHDEVSFLIEDKEAALSITKLVELYLEPAMVAHAAKLDTRLLGLYTDVITAGNYVGTYGTDASKAAIISAGTLMNVNLVPKAGRKIVWAPKDEAALLNIAEFTNNQYGSDGNTGLREWQVQRRYGFDHMMDQGVPVTAGTPNQTNNLAFVRDAFALVTRPLPLPPAEFGVKAANVEVDGVSFRVVIAYNPNRLGVQVTIDILYGVKTVRPELACVIKT